MTEDQAALCMQTYWRRYASIANYQENRGAAITIQAVFRGMDDRKIGNMRADAVAQQQETRRLKKEDDLVGFRAATALQA